MDKRQTFIVFATLLLGVGIGLVVRVPFYSQSDKPVSRVLSSPIAIDSARQPQAAPAESQYQASPTEVQPAELRRDAVDGGDAVIPALSNNDADTELASLPEPSVISGHYLDDGYQLITAPAQSSEGELQIPVVLLAAGVELENMNIEADTDGVRVFRPSWLEQSRADASSSGEPPIRFLLPPHLEGAYVEVSESDGTVSPGAVPVR